MIINCEKHNSNIIDQFYQLLLHLYIILLPVGTALSGIVGNISIMNYLALGIIIIAFSKIANSRKLTIEKIAIPTILYFIYTVLSVVWSVEPKFNWYIATNSVNFFLLIALISREWSQEEIKRIDKCMYPSQIIVLIAVLINLSSISEYRLNITIFTTMGINDFPSGLCLLTAFWMKTVTGTASLKKRMFAVCSIAINFLIAILAGSRGALVMLVAMSIIWICKGKFSNKQKVMTIIIIILGSVVFLTNFYQLLPESITGRMSLEAIKESKGSGRFNIWELALQDFLGADSNNILFGHGFDSFSEVVSYGSHGGHKDLMAHNFVVQTMIEGGVAGLLLLFFMVFSQLRIAWKNNDDYMIIALAGLFVVSLAIDMQVTRVFGFVLALNLMRNREKKKSTIMS